MRPSVWLLLIITTTSLNDVAGCATSCRSVAAENGDRVTCRCIAEETGSKKQERSAKPDKDLTSGEPKIFGTIGLVAHKQNLVQNKREGTKKLMVSRDAGGTENISMTGDSSKDLGNKVGGGTIGEGLYTLVSTAANTLFSTFAAPDMSQEATKLTGGPATDSKIKTLDFQSKTEQKNVTDTNAPRKRSSEPPSSDLSPDQVIAVDKHNCVRRCFKSDGRHIHCVVTRGCKRIIEQAQKRRHHAEILKTLRKIHWQWL